MTRKIVISAAVAFCIGFMLAPPDLISMIISGVLAALLCVLPLLILARFRFVRSASKAIHTLVCVLVCAIALLSLECYMLNAAVARQAERLQEPTAASSSPTTPDGQMQM